MRITEIANYWTLAEVKTYLRVEHNADDTFITDLMNIAREQADLFVQNDFRIQNEVGGWVDTPIPFSVKLACLKMVASWFETRSDDIRKIDAGGVTTELGEMPWDAQRLLFPYRKLVGL